MVVAPRPTRLRASMGEVNSSAALDAAMNVILEPLSGRVVWYADDVGLKGRTPDELLDSLDATAAASCSLASSNEADCDARTSAAARSSSVSPSAAATSRGRRRAAAWAATSGSSFYKVGRQRVDCVSGQQPHLPVSAVSDQGAHDGAVPA